MGRGVLRTRARTGAQPMALPGTLFLPLLPSSPFPSLSLSLVPSLTSAASVEEKEIMDSNSPPPSTTSTYQYHKPPFLVVLNAALMLLGSDGSLLLRLYFVHDGHHLCLSTFLHVSAWPILLLPLSISHLFLPTAGPIATRRCCRLFLLLPWPLSAASAVLGLLIVLDSYLYAYGSSYFPLSTSSLLMASQMAFTAIFAFLIVHQHFIPFSLNSVVLLMLGPIVLSLSRGGNRLIFPQKHKKIFEKMNRNLDNHP